MLNFVLWLVFFSVFILTKILQFYPSWGFFCPHTDKHLAILSKRTFDTQSIHIFGLFLEIEKGRHQNIPLNERICKLCKLEIEDEIHFLLQCPILNSFRTEAMQQISDICKNFATLDNKSKFIWLLSNENIIIINIVIKLLMSLTETSTKLLSGM
jgi:hypothetical protein